MINLLGSDYIVSQHNLDETFSLVINAINGCSKEQFFWKVVEDRPGSRVTAVMEYQKAIRLKRRLILEVNFYPVEDNRVRLELRYTIHPMINIREPEALLTQAADTIAHAVGGEFMGGKDAPLVVLDTPQAKSQSGMLTGIEIVLGINFFVMIVAGFTGHAQDAVAWLLSVQVGLLVPVGIIYMLYRAMSRPGQTAFGGVMVAIASIIGGVLICILAAPLILFGLCIGAMMLYQR